MQQMMRRSRRATVDVDDDYDSGDDDDDYDDDNDDDDDDSDVFRRTADNLKVFCCSAREFLKLSGRWTKGGRAQVLTSTASK